MEICVGARSTTVYMWFGCMYADNKVIAGQVEHVAQDRQALW